MITNNDLLKLGFDPKYDGFQALIEVVNTKIQDKKITMQEIYKQLFETKGCYTSPKAIERSLRTIISQCKTIYQNNVRWTVKGVVNDLALKYERLLPSESKHSIRFQKVSFGQFKADMKACGYDWSEKHLRELYDAIKLPKRATKGSAGYDFYMPFDITLLNGVSYKFPTGIRCEMDDDVVLMLFPRSSLGFKHRMALDNSTGIVDSDYAFAKNEGHIHSKMHYNNRDVSSLLIKQGDAYMQGIFVNYLTTSDDDTYDIRVGGLGSTSKNGVRG